ncbi:pentatricopeptide repeat-containing protein At2g35030, mitochondrial-like [Magnolia sinica]|uniref:pentatricopeptide repeat-containing protein At2g35030, mitochondrial-like n=1 Tax=Magnolia sinica TaxID=86752 RepID=UPI002657D7FE|nr:pentatricopeptide repeat-containing protein At2g35030, mitochondrial-like [Magnolia sinica]
MGHVHDGQSEEAMKIFSRMLNDGIKPNQGTFFNNFVESTLISMYAICGEISIAREMFDRSNQKNLGSWNGMIAASAHHGYAREAIHLFDKMRQNEFEPDGVTYAGVVDPSLKKQPNGCVLPDVHIAAHAFRMFIVAEFLKQTSEEAMKIFSRMLNDGIKPNQGTFVSVLSACSSSLAGLGEGKQIHQIMSKTIFQFNNFVESTLISMYAICGEISIAREMFDRSNQKNLGSWNGMITASAHHGYAREGIHLFDKMRQNEFEPNDVTYAGVVDPSLKKQPNGCVLPDVHIAAHAFRMFIVAEFLKQTVLHPPTHLNLL